MGSDSDLPTMQAAIDVLAEFGVAHEVRIVSAHRTPDVMTEYARTAADRGLEVIIAGAGGAAHLPGPYSSLAAIATIVQMPTGIPVATVAVGNAANAGLLAVRILAAADRALRERMVQYQESLAATVREKDARLER